ncbi:hypothetical protein E2C01_021726 [Portunus trituberculatus]|uniref:Uncharacterized protein n=1 Tax=Portunus trituberculatus TaxID=210409 RepID=A0A5B7E3H3_PORTR|nr:hypothetical protein [Portunus trituberculatus]
MTEELEVGNLPLYFTDHVQVFNGFAVEDFNGNFSAGNGLGARRLSLDWGIHGCCYARPSAVLL